MCWWLMEISSFINNLRIFSLIRKFYKNNENIFLNIYNN